MLTKPLFNEPIVNVDINMSCHDLFQQGFFLTETN